MRRTWYVQTTPSTWVGVKAWLRPIYPDGRAVHSAAEHDAYLREQHDGWTSWEPNPLWPVTTFGVGMAAGVAPAYRSRYGL